MLPPTRSRASVTRMLSGAHMPCRVASACAVHSPLIPAPTTTHSAPIRGVSARGGASAGVATLLLLGIAHKTRHLDLNLELERPRLFQVITPSPLQFAVTARMDEADADASAMARIQKLTAR
jgi:hypothetical protein